MTLTAANGRLWERLTISRIVMQPNRLLPPADSSESPSSPARTGTVGSAAARVWRFYSGSRRFMCCGGRKQTQSTRMVHAQGMSLTLRSEIEITKPQVLAPSIRVCQQARKHTRSDPRMCACWIDKLRGLFTDLLRSHAGELE